MSEWLSGSPAGPRHAHTHVLCSLRTTRVSRTHEDGEPPADVVVRPPSAGVVEEEGAAARALEEEVRFEQRLAQRLQEHRHGCGCLVCGLVARVRGGRGGGSVVRWGRSKLEQTQLTHTHTRADDCSSSNRHGTRHPMLLRSGNQRRRPRLCLMQRPGSGKCAYVLRWTRRGSRARRGGLSCSCGMRGWGLSGRRARRSGA